MTELNLIGRSRICFVLRSDCQACVPSFISAMLGGGLPVSREFYLLCTVNVELRCQ